MGSNSDICYDGAALFSDVIAGNFLGKSILGEQWRIQKYMRNNRVCLWKLN